MCMHSLAARVHALELVEAGLSDCEVARRTGIARTTIRDWRRPPSRQYRGRSARICVTCPRCGRAGRQMSFAPGDYAELLGLYLGDGYLVRTPRTWRFRLYLDSKHHEIVNESSELMRRCFRGNSVTHLYRHDGAMTVLSVYSSHLRVLQLLPGHPRHVLRDLRSGRRQVPTVRQAHQDLSAPERRADGGARGRQTLDSRVHADVVKLVNTRRSGRRALRGLEVRVLSSASPALVAGAWGAAQSSPGDRPRRD
jgi:Homeodomain-like domain